jgi:predicted thioredoxin/glutaredoxin
LANTVEFAELQRQRKKVEALFAELKNQIGLRRLRLLRLKFVRELFWLAAVAQNIKRLVRIDRATCAIASPAFRQLILLRTATDPGIIPL